LAKYLPEFGWQPIVLTPPIGEDPDSRFGPPNDFKDSNRVIETYGYSSRHTWKKRHRLDSKKLFKPAKPLLRFLYKHYLEIINYPDEEKGWKPFAVKAGDEFLRNEGVDAIISSSSPVTTHIIAKELKIKRKIPWVADLRDLWTQNHDYPYSFIRRFFERRLERKTLQSADALVTVSEPLAEKLMELHKGKRVYNITSGFDPDDMKKEPADLTPRFTITYTGQIYVRGQDASKFLIALRDSISEGAIMAEDVEVRFYGPWCELLAKQIEEYGLVDVVKQYGIISRQVSFEKQRESQVLLLLKWEDVQERGYLSGKIFEYLAAGRPMIAAGGHNDVVTLLLNETNAGIDGQSVEDIKNALRKLYVEYKLRGKTSYHGIMKEINKYSYLEMTRKFAAVLDDLYGREI
jgi:glycosyltransferase involved in cell wall biosynthesis